jgi:hypothetical protein
VTASRFSFAVVVLAGCGVRGLPPVPPAEDPANPAAAVPAYAAPAEGLDASAFEGENLDEGGHSHHGDHARHPK